MHPKTRLKMNNRLFLRRRNELSDISDSLSIRHAVQHQISLRVQTAIGHISETLAECHSLTSEVKLQDIISGVLRRRKNGERGRRLCAVGSENGVEAKATVGAMELCQNSQL